VTVTEFAFCYNGVELPETRLKLPRSGNQLNREVKECIRDIYYLAMHEVKWREIVGFQYDPGVVFRSDRVQRLGRGRLG